jgi:hypothetical protein
MKASRRSIYDVPDILSVPDVLAIGRGAELVARLVRLEEEAEKLRQRKQSE